ncbi:MAG: aminopeptidase [Vulcanimicrobiota bacterium]
MGSLLYIQLNYLLTFIQFMKKNFKKILIVLLVVSLIILLTRPIVKYLLVQGYHQAKVIFTRQSLKDALENTELEPEFRKKIMLVEEIKQFGQEELGLNRGDSYTTIYDTRGQPAVWAVSASYKDKLVPLAWKFPVVGEMPYLGFFSKEDARKEYEKLDKKGYDVIMRPVSAYSTLGILPDPLFSSMLNYSEASLAATILHEMTHETVFIKDKVDFNESFASFVGNQGAVEFLSYKFGPDSSQLKQLQDYRHDSITFSDFMADFYEEMNEFYNQPISKEDKIKGREKQFENVKTEFEEKIKPRLKTGSFDYFVNLKLNNAYLLFNRRYHHKENKFRKLFIINNSDLKQTVEYVNSLKKNKEIEKIIDDKISELKDNSDKSS